MSQAETTRALRAITEMANDPSMSSWKHASKLCTAADKGEYATGSLCILASATLSFVSSHKPKAKT